MSNTPPAERLTVAGIELEHSPERTSDDHSHIPETWRGENGRIHVVLRRFYSPYGANDDGQRGDRWISEVFVRRNKARVAVDREAECEQRIHVARCYGLTRAITSAELFLADLQAAAGSL